MYVCTIHEYKKQYRYVRVRETWIYDQACDGNGYVCVCVCVYVYSHVCVYIHYDDVRAV